VCCRCGVLRADPGGRGGLVGFPNCGGGEGVRPIVSDYIAEGIDESHYRTWEPIIRRRYSCLLHGSYGNVQLPLSSGVASIDGRRERCVWHLPPSGVGIFRVLEPSV